MSLSPHLTTTYAMKLSILLLLVLAGPILCAVHEDPNTEAYQRKMDQDRELQIQEVVKECAEINRKASQGGDDQAISQYGYVLKRLGGWQRPDTLEVYQAAQQKLLSIPGHATYFRDKIKAAQVEVKAGKLPLWQWDNLKLETFGALQHMPSEETVEVLMEFVNDNFADQSSENPEDYKIPNLGPNDSGHFKVNSAATSALAVLGIEPMPYTEKTRPQLGGTKDLWVKWWQEVKTGKRKYRFKGSSVEHPIHTPPGAPREVRRPDRHPETSPSAGSQKPGPSTNGASAPESGNVKWPLALCGVVLLAGLLIYWVRRRK